MGTKRSGHQFLPGEQQVSAADVWPRSFAPRTAPLRIWAVRGQTEQWLAVYSDIGQRDYMRPRVACPVLCLHHLASLLGASIGDSFLG